MVVGAPEQEPALGEDVNKLLGSCSYPAEGEDQVEDAAEEGDHISQVQSFYLVDHNVHLVEVVDRSFHPVEAVDLLVDRNFLPVADHNFHFAVDHNFHPEGIQLLPLDSLLEPGGTMFVVLVVEH